MKLILNFYISLADTLEQVVGIKNVVQCHGSFATATCMICKTKVEAEVIREDIFAQKIPLCQVCELGKADKNEHQPKTSTSSIPPPEVVQHQPSGDDAGGVQPAEGEKNLCKQTADKVSDPAAANNLPEPEAADVVPQVIPSIMKPDIVFFGEGLGKNKSPKNVELVHTVSSEGFLHKVAPPELKISPNVYFIMHNSVVLSKILPIIVP